MLRLTKSVLCLHVYIVNTQEGLDLDIGLP